MCLGIWMPLKLPSFTGHCLERARSVRSKTATSPLGKNRFMFHVSSKAASSILRSIRLQIIDVFSHWRRFATDQQQTKQSINQVILFHHGHIIQYIVDHSCAIWVTCFRHSWGVSIQDNIDAIFNNKKQPRRWTITLPWLLRNVQMRPIVNWPWTASGYPAKCIFAQDAVGQTNYVPRPLQSHKKTVPRIKE